MGPALHVTVWSLCSCPASFPSLLQKLASHQSSMSHWSRWQWVKARSWAWNATSAVLLHWPSSGWKTGGSWSQAETPESHLLVGWPVWRSAQSQRPMQGITSARPAMLPAVTSASPGSLWKVTESVSCQQPVRWLFVLLSFILHFLHNNEFQILYCYGWFSTQIL